MTILDNSLSADDQWSLVNKVVVLMDVSRDRKIKEPDRQEARDKLDKIEGILFSSI